MIRKGACLLCVLCLPVLIALASPDDYAARKAAMIGPGGGATRLHNLWHNDSIGVNVDTETGQFNIGTMPDSTTLIFMFPSSPSTSNTVLNIDDTVNAEYVNDDFTSFATSIMDVASSTIPFTSYPATGGSTYVEGGWVVDNIRIIQKVMPVYLERDDGKISGSVYIQYRVANLDAVSHHIGVRLQMDTMVDDNDRARLATIFGYSGTDDVFTAPNIPATYSAYKDSFADGSPDPMSLKATGYLSPGLLAPNATTPDRFAVGNWGVFRSYEPWYYYTDSSSYTDSAVMLWWEDDLAPGDSVIYGTYYGIGLPDFTPPIATPLAPGNNVWTSCAGTDVVLRLEDDESINESTIQLEVDGTLFSPSDPELTWIPGDNLLIFVPPANFTNNSTVDVTLYPVSDYEGNAMATSVSWSFKVDSQGPAITAMAPNGVLAPSLSPTLCCNILDAESGVDPTSVEIEVDGFSYGSGTPGLNYDPVSGDFSFDLSAAGVSFPTGYTVDVQVSCNDMVDTCAPNLIQPHLWSFVTSVPPIPVLVTPGNGDTTTCEDEEIHIDLSSGSGIDEASIVLWINTDSFTVDDDELEFVRDTIYFRPSGLYTYTTGEVTIMLAAVYDTLGASSDTAVWHFYVDLEPPVMSNETPTSPPLVSATIFPIAMDIVDNMLPIDYNNIEVQIINNNNADTTRVLGSDAFVSWAAPNFSFSSGASGVSFVDGEIVTVRLLVRDLPPATSSCQGNLLDTLFFFQIAETPCQRGPNPITPGVSLGKNDDVTFQFPNMRKAGIDVHIFIYDLRNNLVTEMTEPVASEWRWDGKDQGGEFAPQGTYIYIIRVDDETVCNGTINIAR